MATTLREGAELINKSLSDLGYDFKIDLTSNETITAGLTAIGAYPPSQRNMIMEQMNLILQQRNYGVMFDSAKNKFRNFIVDMSPNGFGIEDVFHEIIDGTETLWDGNATAEEIARDLVEYKDNDIQKFFHTTGASRKFDTTIDDRNYEKVFTPYGVTRYIDTRLANLAWSAEFWFMTRVINIMKNIVVKNEIVTLSGHNINNKHGLDNVVETIKSVVAGFKTPSTLYNKGYYRENNGAGVGGYTPVINMTNSDDDIFIVTTPEIMARLKVMGYSNAFNLSEYELDGRIIYAPAGTDFGRINGEQVYALVFDRRSIVIGIKKWLATTFYVSNTGWINHFLNVEILEGYNTIFNSVAITGAVVDNYVDNGRGSIVTISAGLEPYVAINSTDGEIELIGEVTPTKLIKNATYIEFSALYPTNDKYVVAVLNGTQILKDSTIAPLTDVRIDLNTDDVLSMYLQWVEGKID